MSTNNSPVNAIHVWLDEQAAQDRDVDAYYSVSEVDETGDEIRCIGGSKNLARAWEIGCEHADDLGVECVEIDAHGSVADRHSPRPQMLKVTIYSRMDDGRWLHSGAGVVVGGHIEDCPADLGDDVYDALDDAIGSGTEPGEYSTEVDGREYQAVLKIE